MNKYLIGLSVVIMNIYPYSYIKMPGEVRRIQSARAKQKNRYQKIGIERDAACSILKFWIPCICQGLNICAQLLADTQYSNKAKGLSEQLQSMGCQLNEDITIKELEFLMPVLGDIKKFYQNLAPQVCSEEINMLVNHFCLELEYLVDLLGSISYSRLGTVQFLNRLNIANIWILKNLLLSSGQRHLIKKAYYLKCHAKKWHCESELLSHTLTILPKFYNLYDLLADNIKRGTLRAHIPCAVVSLLIEHFIKIADYTNEILQKLKKS